MTTYASTDWSIGEPERKTFFIQTKGNRRKKQDEGTVPVSIIYLPLKYRCLDGTEEQWLISFARGKFSLKYPDSIVDKDQRGFHRPNGKKIVENKDTSLSAEALYMRLIKKFPKTFVRQVLLKLKSVA